MRRQTYGYLHSRKASPPVGWYQIILLGDRGTCVLTTCPGLHSIVERSGVELATCWSQVQRPNHSVTEPHWLDIRQIPFSSSLHASATRNLRVHTTYRDASRRSPYTYTIHALPAGKNQEHVYARVCSALTYSVLQCPGVMPGFTGDWRLGPLSGLGMKQALALLWTMGHERTPHRFALKIQKLPHECQIFSTFAEIGLVHCQLKVWPENN